MPQGSAAGANMFNLYCSTLKELQLSGFADDHSVHCELDANNRQDESNCLNKVQDCMLNIKQWMDAVQLKMNSAKMEFIYFGNKVQLHKCSHIRLNVNGDLIERTHVIRYLGAWLDEGLTYKTHITKNAKQPWPISRGSNQYCTS